MLFKKKKKPAPAQPKPIARNEKVYEMPYSKGFRGFKRFAMSVHNDKEAETNNEKLYNNDFSGSRFQFVCFTDQYNSRVAALYINGVKMGNVYDQNQVYAIEHGLIEKIHVEPKEEVVLGNKCTETRHRISVLVKYIQSDEN